MQSFYDFVPHTCGPFSFALYRELQKLGDAGVIDFGDTITLTPRGDAVAETCKASLPPDVALAAEEVARSHGRQSLTELIGTIYAEHPWFALNSERPERRLVSVPSRPKADLAIHATGYEGRSVDAFLDHLLRSGIHTLIDTRAVPVSRKYGFANSALSRLCGHLEIEYVHLASLGIPSSDRKLLGNGVTHAQLFEAYSARLASRAPDELDVAVEHMTTSPAALACVEKDPALCHRTPLARHLASITNLEINHV